MAHAHGCQTDSAFPVTRARPATITAPQGSWTHQPFPRSIPSNGAGGGADRSASHTSVLMLRHDSKLTGVAGEHYVCAKLARRDWAPSLTRCTCTDRRLRGPHHDADYQTGGRSNDEW